MKPGNRQSSRRFSDTAGTASISALKASQVSLEGYSEFGAMQREKILSVSGKNGMKLRFFFLIESGNYYCTECGGQEHIRIMIVFVRKPDKSFIF
ncbi:MAG: hypothetical protein LBQ79_01410 [Deltaproteobacteria bacterium]|jgi:hypothetical protein|nr:hypothetical protein [Deltaproteobacteria bacterium]